MPWVADHNVVLLADLYELTMAASYHARGMTEVATFDLFVRHLPETRRFLVSCGLDQALDYLENLHFDDGSLDYLASLAFFDDDFLSYLSKLRFTGRVRAVPEGEIVFANEPILSVTAPMVEAQIVETFLINCITYQTMVASKAARVHLACRDKTFVDFSLRRDHGVDAGLKAARSAYVAGASATSNVLAGRIWGIPVSGTMAHSYVMAFADEADAFRAFSEDFPDRSILLIDTFDTEEGARKAARVAREFTAKGIAIRGVRIDSGDLIASSFATRKILDEAGLDNVQIFVSGDLDEERIAAIVAAGAPVDAFGVGTQLGTSGDAPSLGGVYKLVEFGGRPVHKSSVGKVTLGGRKQVYRFPPDGCDRDLIALEDEDVEGGRPLMRDAMVEGARTAPPEPLENVRRRCLRGIACLPDELRSLEKKGPRYRIDLSAAVGRERRPT